MDGPQREGFLYLVRTETEKSLQIESERMCLCRPAELERGSLRELVSGADGIESGEIEIEFRLRARDSCALSAANSAYRCELAILDVQADGSHCFRAERKCVLMCSCFRSRLRLRLRLHLRFSLRSRFSFRLRLFCLTVRPICCCRHVVKESKRVSQKKEKTLICSRRKVV